MRNAFNNASWQIILDNLQRRRVEKSLVNIIGSYLSERTIIIEAERQTKTTKINSGVPQGSVLGPTLWNVLYDDLLKLQMPDGVTLIGFADDIALIAVAKTEQQLMNIADTALLRVASWIESRQLKLAPEKTEAIVLTYKRKMGQIRFNVKNIVVTPSKAIKYLGVWLDPKLTFAEHIKKTTEKAERTISALSRLMPNIGGPRASKRRVMASVVHSQMLYAAPVWYTITENKKLLNKTARLQRLMCIRICSGYRTISSEAAGVISGVPPIEFMIHERREKYNGEDSNMAKQRVITRWQDKWENTTKGRWTRKLIPDIQAWINRPYGEVDYFLSQALSGHGCFRKYLYDRRRTDSEQCNYCDLVDDAEHTLYTCPKWDLPRSQFTQQTGQEFNIVNMMRSLRTSKDTWSKAYATIRTIIESKERDTR